MAQRDNTHEHRIKTVEERTDAHGKRIDEYRGRISRLEYWRDGNGSRGAEERLQRLEANYMTEPRVSELIERSSERTANYVLDEMHKRGNHKFRDWLTALSTLGTIGAMVVMLVALTM